MAGGALLLIPRSSTTPDPARAAGRPLVALLLGLVLAGGVLAANLTRASDLAPPEGAILAYGALLLVASARLDRPRVAASVAWSFPLVAAPLGLWALDAGLATYAGARPLHAYVEWGLVAPMAAILGAGGLDVGVLDDTVRLATPRGDLFLTVGVVCAGLYAGVLFLGVFSLFAWERRLPPARFAAHLAAGLLGLHVANVLRLVLLGAVGWTWGGEALMDAHRHLGWVLFLLFAFAYWAVVLRRLETRPA